MAISTDSPPCENQFEMIFLDTDIRWMTLSGFIRQHPFCSDANEIKLFESGSIAGI